MIDETLNRLEERIRSSARTSDAAKRDLLALVGELRTELAEIAETHAEDAHAIAGHAESAAEGPVAGVEESMRDFETAHPKVAGLVRSFLRTLADAGI
jgi:hypothetical protein